MFSLPRLIPAALVFVPVLFLSGCNLLNLSALGISPTKSGSSGASTSNLTGNYSFTGVPSSVGATTPAPVSGFTGAIGQTGTNFNAILRLASNPNCADPAQDLTFTGSEASSGQITLTSSTLASNPITITWLDDPTQSSNGVGSYTITGSGPCSMPATNFFSDQYLPVTGTWTGTFTSTKGVVATVTATLTQQPANADGQFPETGSLVLTTPSCTNNFTVSGLVTGPNMTIVFNPDASGNTLGGFSAILPDHVLSLAIPNGIIVAGDCNAGTYAGSLSQQ